MHEKFKLNLKKNFLTLRIIKHKNGLPLEIVAFISLKGYKIVEAALCLQWFRYGSKWKWPLWESGRPGDLSQSLLDSKFHYSVILLKRSNSCNNAHSFRGQASGNLRSWYIALNLKGKKERKKKEALKHEEILTIILRPLYLFSWKCRATLRPFLDNYV